MRSQWFLCALVLVPAATSPTVAQPPREPKDGKLVVPLVVSAVPVPVPALKYQLLPELRDLRPGNQVPAFSKCFMEQHAFYREKESVSQREKWAVAPLTELAGVKELVDYGGSSARQADYAARLDMVDWAILDQLKTQGPTLLLPDVQQLRGLAQVLRVKMRSEIARKDYPTALRTAQTMFALARSLNEHPTLIGQLIGVAITTITLGVVEELVAQPDAPNLFWALTDLPTPFIDMRKGMQGERALVGADFDVLRKANPIPEAERNRLVKKLDSFGLTVLDGSKKLLPSAWYAEQVADPAKVAAAKTRLATLYGHPVADLDKLAALQIVMMDDYAWYEVYRDDLMKCTQLPARQLPTEEYIAPHGAFSELPPGVRKVLQARDRCQQHIALLTVVEAVRAYAAKNGGTLPPALEAIELPVPVDPFTGKAFVYERKDATAIIRATPPPDRKSEPAHNRVYEVTIRK